MRPGRADVHIEKGGGGEPDYQRGEGGGEDREILAGQAIGQQDAEEAEQVRAVADSPNIGRAVPVGGGGFEQSQRVQSAQAEVGGNVERRPEQCRADRRFVDRIAGERFALVNHPGLEVGKLLRVAVVEVHELVLEAQVAIEVERVQVGEVFNLVAGVDALGDDRQQQHVDDQQNEQAAIHPSPPDLSAEC